MEVFQKEFKFGAKTGKHFIKWMLIALITGIVVGLVGTAFVKGLTLANNFRLDNPNIIYGLPFAGLFLVFLLI